MPRNPDKRPCQAQSCRAWAVRDSDPPLCSSHAGRNVGAGAPLANQNRRTHGFYATVLTHQEVADLDTYSADTSLDAEIACARVALRRVVTLLAGEDSAQQGNSLSLTDYARLAGLVFQGARTVAHLVSIRSKLDSSPNVLEAAMHAALDELSEQWGIEL